MHFVSNILSISGTLYVRIPKGISRVVPLKGKDSVIMCASQGAVTFEKVDLTELYNKMREGKYEEAEPGKQAENDPDALPGAVAAEHREAPER